MKFERKLLARQMWAFEFIFIEKVVVPRFEIQSKNLSIFKNFSKNSKKFEFLKIFSNFFNIFYFLRLTNRSFNSKFKNRKKNENQTTFFNKKSTLHFTGNGHLSDNNKLRLRQSQFTKNNYRPRYAEQSACCRFPRKHRHHSLPD